MAFIRKLARYIGAPGTIADSRLRADDRDWDAAVTPDGGIVMTLKPRSASSGWPPHPLDVNIRQLPRETRHLRAGGNSVEAYVADCPDGCGVVAWTDTMLPFNAPDSAAAEAAIIRSYSR